MNEFEWQRQLRQLAQPREPQRDLWAGIAAGIAVPAARQSASSRPWLWAAAAMLLLACGTVFVVQRLSIHADRSEFAAAPSALRSTAPALTASAAVDGTDQRDPHLERTALDWARPSQRPLSAAARELDSASAELQQAIELRPDAVFLVGLLNRTNAQRMRLTRFSASAG